MSEPEKMVISKATLLKEEGLFLGINSCSVDDSRGPFLYANSIYFFVASEEGLKRVRMFC